MSVEIGTYKRVATILVTAVTTGQPGPAGAVLIATDTETSLDIYATTSFSWVKVA